MQYLNEQLLSSSFPLVSPGLTLLSQSALSPVVRLNSKWVVIYHPSVGRIMKKMMFPTNSLASKIWKINEGTNFMCQVKCEWSFFPQEVKILPIDLICKR